MQIFQTKYYTIKKQLERWIVAALCFLSFFLIPGNLLAAKPFFSYLQKSVRLNISGKETDYLKKLSKLNKQIKAELSSREITDLLNRIESKGYEKEILVNFSRLVLVRDKHNRKIDNWWKNKSFQDAAEKNAAKRFYSQLKIETIPKKIKEMPYIYPVLLPFAKYVQLKDVNLSDLSNNWLQNENNFKLCFFYLYRNFAHLKRMPARYNKYLLLASKSNPRTGSAKKLREFLRNGIGFKFFAKKFNTGTFNPGSKFFDFDGYQYKYIQQDAQPETAAARLAKIFKTYCNFYKHTPASDLEDFYNNRKLSMFMDLTRELEQNIGAPGYENYLPLLYYITRTFPNISAFILTSNNGKYKFTDREKTSPVFERLKQLWAKIEKYEQDNQKRVELLQYTLGSIYLLPQRELLVDKEDYTFDRSGYATYIQEYISIYNKHHKAIPIKAKAKAKAKAPEAGLAVPKTGAAPLVETGLAPGD